MRPRFGIGLAIVLLAISLMACQRKHETNSPSQRPQQLMGGSVQGAALSLAGNVTTFAGIAPGSINGTGISAKFRWPPGVTTDGINLYVTDRGNSTIRKIVISTDQVSTIAGTAGAFGSADGVGVAVRFNYPFGITTDGTNLYVADSGNSNIRKIIIADGLVTTIAGTAVIQGSSDGIGIAAYFNQPMGIATDGTNLYVADSGNNTIRKIVISTGQVSTFAGTAGATGSADGIGASARFNWPQMV